MTVEELKAQALEELGGYPQYIQLLNTRPLRVGIAKVRKSPRGQVWFEKGEHVLVIGETKFRDDLGSTEHYVTVYSSHYKGLCLTPLRTLEII